MHQPQCYLVTGRYKFESVNFDLLVRIYQQLNENERPLLVSSLLELIPSFGTAWNSLGGVRFPSWDGCFSCLPLVAEFCVRTRNTGVFIESLLTPKLPTTGLQIMLLQLAEMVAVNFNVFSDAELARLSDVLGELSNIAGRQTWVSKRDRGSTKVIENPDYQPGFEKQGKAMLDTIVGIAEQCRKARYFYLKGALQQTINLDVETDKSKVESFLVKLGYRDDMVNALDTAESDYKSTATAFELKNCLGHLRSFLEHLHRDEAKSIAAVAGDVVKDRWGDATGYLSKQGFFTKQHETFATSLYTLISDTSVHPLGAEREYARLLRNVVIEYGVMFLTVLDKKGVKI